MLSLCLALFIYVACQQQWILLETGGEESLFGYDFSQGYTSLERDAAGAAAAASRPNFVAALAAAPRRPQAAARAASSARPRSAAWTSCWRRSSARAWQSLTDEERRFLKRVSDRYRNRQS